MRGSLVICGRPDGRLSALSTAEAAVCLSVNQASSIQSLGGTCESITIGHNPFKLSLSEKGIFLQRKRPLFLCERILVESDVKEERSEEASCIVSRDDVPTFPRWLSSATGRSSLSNSDGSMHNRDSTARRDGSTRWSVSSLFAIRSPNTSRSIRAISVSLQSYLDSSVRLQRSRHRSASALISAYVNFEEASRQPQCPVRKKFAMKLSR